MALRFYLSARKDRAVEVQHVVEQFTTAGWERTYAWYDLGNASREDYSRAAVEELNGVRAADTLIVLLPAGFGTHVEIGAALAVGKPVILHSPDRKTLETPYPCIFHYHPAVKLFISDPLRVSDLIHAAAEAAATRS